MMLIYLFMSQVTARIVRSSIDRTIGEEVKKGTIAMNLIRPINYQLRVLFRNIGDSLYNFFFIGMPLWIGVELFRYFVLGDFLPGLLPVILYFLSAFFSFIILFLVNLSFGLFAFYVTNMWGFSRLKNAIIAFLSGRLIPLNFFPDWAQTILNFSPFSSLNYVPVMIYLNRIEGLEVVQNIFIQLIWIIILLVINKVLWKKAILKLTIFGG